jgi:hypothetical protein
LSAAERKRTRPGTRSCTRSMLWGPVVGRELTGGDRAMNRRDLAGSMEREQEWGCPQNESFAARGARFLPPSKAGLLWNC